MFPNRILTFLLSFISLAELEVPLPEQPNDGRIEFFVDCSANATPEFEGRGGNELATEISRILSRAYRDPQVFDLKSLCLLPGRQVLYHYFIFRYLALIRNQTVWENTCYDK